MFEQIHDSTTYSDYMESLGRAKSKVEAKCGWNAVSDCRKNRPASKLLRV